jgi:hypothetical protein
MGGMMAIAAATQEPTDVQVDQDEEFAVRKGLTPWRAVAEEFNRRTGEQIGRSRAEQIGKAALVKMRKALRLMGVGPGDV